MTTARIITTTDKKFIGQSVEVDEMLTMATLPSGDAISFSGRAHLGGGIWRLWNSNYTLEVTLEEDTQHA